MTTVDTSRWESILAPNGGGDAASRWGAILDRPEPAASRWESILSAPAPTREGMVATDHPEPGDAPQHDPLSGLDPIARRKLDLEQSARDRQNMGPMPDMGEPVTPTMHEPAPRSEFGAGFKQAIGAAIPPGLSVPAAQRFKETQARQKPAEGAAGFAGGVVGGAVALPTMVVPRNPGDAMALVAGGPIGRAAEPVVAKIAALAGEKVAKVVAHQITLGAVSGSTAAVDAAGSITPDEWTADPSGSVWRVILAAGKGAASGVATGTLTGAVHAAMPGKASGRPVESTPQESTNGVPQSVPEEGQATAGQGQGPPVWEEGPVGQAKAAPVRGEAQEPVQPGLTDHPAVQKALADGGTIPERPETLKAQAEAVAGGKKPAMLVTPGAEMSAVPEGLQTHETKAGMFIYDPGATDPAKIQAAVDADAFGKILGYGSDTKPEGGDKAVVVRTADGTEKHAEVVNDQTMPAAQDAARKVAGPGDTISVESPVKVVEGRLREGEPAPANSNPPDKALVSPESPSAEKLGHVTDSTAAVPPETGRTGSPESDTTGIAHRVSEARGTEATRGEGINPEDSIERGRQLLKEGADAEKAAAGPLSADAMAVVRAHAETLSKAANAAADKHGVDSPEYRAANKAERDWIERIKPMQTEWHRIGQAQQGETEIDTGTFHGLHRAYQESSGKEFTPKQAQAAKGMAKNVQEKSGAVVEAQKKLYAAIGAGEQAPRVKSLADRIVAKLDTVADAALARIKARHAGTTLRSGLDPTDLADLSVYGAAKIAKGFTRFAEWSAEMVRDAGEFVRPHLKEVWEASDKALDAHVEGESGKKAARAVRKQITESNDITKHEPGATMTPARVRALWEKAKTDYIAKGVTGFDDVVNGLATDLGLPVKDIRNGLAQTKGARVLTNELYAKQAEQRRVINHARNWVKDAAKPGWIKFIQGVPRAFFTAKVFGHGTVGMVTHAGNQMFNPTEAKAYWVNFGRQYKLLGSSAYDEMMKQDLARRPNYITARRAGLANDVSAQMGDYEKGILDRSMSKIGLAGNRGFSALKFFRQDMFDHQWDRLPASLKTKAMAGEIADSINHATGYVKKPMGGQMGAAILFAPKLEASRWAFLIGDPALAAKRFANWKNETPEARASAVREVKQKAIIASTYLGALAVNQGLLSAVGSDDTINFTDPKRSDFLSFKMFGHNVGVVGPIIGTVKFLANIARAAGGERTKLDAATSTRADKMMEVTGKYVRGKLSPFAQVGTDLATQSDYSGRPMPFSEDRPPAYLRRKGVERFGYGEYTAQAALPIPLEEAVKEAIETDGPLAWKMLKAVIVGVSSSTGARIKESNP